MASSCSQRVVKRTPSPACGRRAAVTLAKMPVERRRRSTGKLGRRPCSRTGLPHGHTLRVLCHALSAGLRNAHDRKQTPAPLRRGSIPSARYSCASARTPECRRPAGATGVRGRPRPTGTGAAPAARRGPGRSCPQLGMSPVRGMPVRERTRSYPRTAPATPVIFDTCSAPCGSPTSAATAPHLMMPQARAWR